MTISARALVGSSTLTAAAVAYYTTPLATTAVIKSATACNTTGGAVSLTVHLVPNAGAAGVSNTVISARSLAAGASDNCAELINKVLPAGASIQALGLALTLVVGGVEIT